MRQKFSEKFFSKHQKKLRGFIQLRVTEEGAVEEILQETMVSAFESMAFFSNRSSCLTWLCGIAKHEIADYYRKKKIKVFLFSHLPWLEDWASEALGPEQVLLRKEFEQRVAQAMRGLKKEYQEVLKLKYYQGLKVVQIAKELNETVKTVESRLFRAKKAFAKAYSSDSS